MSDEYTPAPWHVVDLRHQKNGQLMIRPDYDIPIANVFTRNERADANARLIAACPIMYEYIIKRAQAGDDEAKQIKESIGVPHAMAMLVKAIAKAEAPR